MNVIELVTKYLPMLDEQYRLESKSAILDTPAEFVQQTRNAKKVKIAKINVDGLADYSRQSGFATGAMDLTWEEHEFTVDRGRALQVDSMDNEESFGMAWGRLVGTFQREKVTPELDAYRFAKYYQLAGTNLTTTLTTDNVLSVIDDLAAEMDDKEVPESDRFIFCNPLVYKLIINDKNIEKHLSVDDAMTKALNKKIYSYNEMPIIKVPSKRFYTKIKLLKGTDGESMGGYEPETDAKVIPLLIVSKSAVMQIVKRDISRYWAPTKREMDATGADGVNPNADAWKFDYRNYHDAWVLDNKQDGIAVVAPDTASSVTSVEITTDDPDVSLSGTGTTKTATISIKDVDTFLAKASVVATGLASKDVTWSTSDRTKAIVDAAGNVVLVGEGEAVITATSVYDGSKSATLTLTITE